MQIELKFIIKNHLDESGFYFMIDLVDLDDLDLVDLQLFNKSTN